jgi:hypothetical protein
MPVLHRLVAICEGDGCGARKEYEAHVNHSGESAADSYGTRDLCASDVEHEHDAPDGWDWVGQVWSMKLLCRACRDGGP